MNLRNTHGRMDGLVGAYRGVLPPTICSAVEIIEQSWTDEALRRKIFWTKESAMATVENGNSVFRLTEEFDDNLIFQNIKEATYQLSRKRMYIPEDKDAIKRITDSVEGITFHHLKLEGGNERHSYFRIDTAKSSLLNASQRHLAEICYGRGNKLEKNLENFNKVGIKEIRFYVLNPTYVGNHVKEGSALVRACRLGNSKYRSMFFAGDSNVTDCSVSLRGVHPLLK